MTFGNRSLFLLLIVGIFAVSKGDWEKDFEDAPALFREQFRNITSDAICSMKPPNESANCKRDFHRESWNITELNEEAAANVNFVCQSSDQLMFNKNSGTFVIERLFKNGTAFDVFQRSGTQISEEYPIDAVYKYRLYRILPEGISKPEVTRLFQRMKVTNPVPIMRATNLTVRCCNESNSIVPGTTSAEVSFNPSTGHGICSYEVICRQTESDNIIYNAELEYGVYEFRLENLTLDTNFTVIVEAKEMLDGVHRVSSNFTTPGRKKPTPPEGITGTQVNTTGITARQVNITMIPSLVGVIVGTISIGIIVFAIYRFFRLRKQKPTQTTLPHIEVDRFEIEPERLTTTRVLGSGAFGIIKLGELRDYHGQTTAVAVKMMRDNTNQADLRSFGLETEMLKALGEHPNIVSFVGCCTVDSHPFLVMEYCSQGDLQSFLRASLFESMISANETGELVSLSPMSSSLNETPQTNSYNLPTTHATAKARIVTMMDMLNYGRQIATGMEFLSSQRIVHCDLATRNILLCDNNTVKISDFGLSRDVYQENIYRKTGNGRMPLKWMAIEALTHQIFSAYSDVWSFGVLLWEIVTLGGDPYPGIPTIDILKFLVSGCRMERPTSCSIPLYDVMLSCWQTNPKQRSSFTDLRQQLDELITMNANNVYLDLISCQNPTSPEYDNLRVSSVDQNFDPLQKPTIVRMDQE